MTEFIDDDLPAVQQWRSSFEPPADAVSYLAEHLDVSAALLFARLLAPEFVLERGCVILRCNYSVDSFEHWWSAAEGNTTSVEYALNHLHLWDLFEPDGAAEERALELLAALIARSWQCHAEASYPDREFLTEVTEDYGPTVVMTSTLKSDRP